ncbi:MAG TPA: Lrp/AsnC ligand binding domain-containing protein [Rhizomicrobium sp.]|nr:Lrp/AsnC ligand binding domain-containing protein [Rhizomicrobium sp.]
MEFKLDATDRRILMELQNDGRITNQDLAKQIRLSPAACFDRVKRLRERGVIKGYSAILDPNEIGLPLIIFVEVFLDRTSEEMFKDFSAAVQRAPEVLECHMVAGGFDYLIKARMKDMDSYRRFLGETLVQFPGVRQTRTYAVLEELKSTTKLPV